DVTVSSAVVRLSGTVGTAEQRDRAVEDAYVPGVRAVFADAVSIDAGIHDDMRRSFRAPPPDDDDLKTAIANALVQDPRILSPAVDVQVDRGVVTLSGMVRGGAAKRAAVAVATDAFGARAVVDLIKVQPVAAVPDDEIARRVLATLRDDPVLADR